MPKSKPAKPTRTPSAGKGAILITGAGSGFGREVALRLSEQGYDVIAGVEIVAQIQSLKEEAAGRGADLRVEKLDVTNPDDRVRAWEWDVAVLLNNAGISEGGSIVDVPEENLYRQFDVNVFGPIMLTQGFAKRMAAKKAGKIVFMSSVAGLATDPFTGPYSASKHAIEAVAEALNKELKEFGVAVATINPGPYLTGFNDRMFETWRRWVDDPSERLFDYAKLAFPHEQHDPEAIYELTTKVLAGEIDLYRNVSPPDQIDEVKKQNAEIWTRKQTRKPGERDPLVRKAYEIEPETPSGD
jgi:hypothetical protein